MSAAPEPSALLTSYDALLVDLDGVVHLGPRPVPGAAAALSHARNAGLRVVFVTNNASRTADEVASALVAMGVDAQADDVLTSSMAAADELARRLPPGSRVLVAGGRGLREPVERAGLVPVVNADDEPVAVVQGWSPDLTWALLAEAAVAVRRGALWIATNTDATLPSPRGPLPGNGAMVAAVAFATGTRPESVGKPQPTLLRAAAERSGVRRPLVIGDRLDTDIAGATAAGFDSLLVLTGVSSSDDLVAAAPGQRPTFVGADLGALSGPAAAIAGSATAGDGLDGLRARCRQSWNETR